MSSFGFSGTNAHVILEEAPQPQPHPLTCERPVHLLALSARTESALGELGGRYAEILGDSQFPIGDLCFTANAGRAHFEHRLAATGFSAEELLGALLNAIPGCRVRDREGIRPIFLFPGQGAQYPGMGKQLFDTQPVFRATMGECAELLKGELDTPLLDVLWGASTHLLDQTAYGQPGLFAVEYALSVLWRSWGIEPAAVLGHSVGEYVAACVAGVYSLADGLKLIARRGRLMQGVAGRGAMAAVRAPESRVRDALRGLEQRVSIAAVNAPESLVISGYEQELHIAEQRLVEAGVTVQRLNVSHAFHSPQMREMQEAFEAAAREIGFHPPRLRIISSVTGQAITRDDMSESAYWRRQISEPVRFHRAMETLAESGNAVFLEVGPGATLIGLGQQCIDSPQATWLASLRRQPEEWQQVLDTLSQLYVRGADVNWAAFDRPYHRRKVPLPTYPFERQRYWIAPPVERSPSTAPISTKQAPSQPGEIPTNGHSDTNSTDNWFYRVAWKERDVPLTVREVVRQWILLKDATGVAETLAALIQSAGCACLVVGGSGVQMERALAGAGASATGIIDLRCLDVAEGSAEEPCLMLTNLVQEVAQIGRSGVAVWSVTRGAQATGREASPVLPWLAPVWALGRTVISEHPEFWGGMVDLDPTTSPAESADLLWRHLAKFDGEDQSVFRNGHRLVARLERCVPPSAKNPEFHSDAAYLVTGGFGALGLEVARWMVRQGARRVILMGRTPLPPRSDWVRLQAEDLHGRAISTIIELESLGASVQTLAVDVGDADALQEFFRSYEENSGPPIRGIVHAAGAMRHALVSETTTNDFRISFRAKVDGAWLLHQASMRVPIDFFVTFSSASAILSSPRLGSYAAANAFLDALGEYRNSEGLPSLSVNWGIWTGIGMAATSGDSVARTSGERGMFGMKVKEGLACLGRLMAGSEGQICVLPIDWKRWDELYPAYMAKPFFSELVGENLAGSALSQSQRQTNELLKRLTDAPESMRLDLVREFVQKAAAGLLGFPPEHRLDPLQPLNELGLDSLMALELRNAVAAGVARSLPATLLFNYPAVEDITMYLSKLLFSTPDGAEQIEILSGSKRNALDDIEDLSDEEVDRMLAMNRKTSQ